MDSMIALVGLGVALGGAIIVAVADASLSRSVLVYLDAVETNVAQLVDAVRSGSTSLVATGMNPLRDRRQNQARALKTIGWLVLILGFGLQFAAGYLVKFSS
jgi:uncharacterized ferredoxin-like protein